MFGMCLLLHTYTCQMIYMYMYVERCVNKVWLLEGVSSMEVCLLGGVSPRYIV